MIFIVIPWTFIGIANSVWHLHPWIDLYGMFLLHAALSFSYILVYPASQADSPSFKILLHIEGSMPQGMTESEIAYLFPQTKLLAARIRDLIDSRLVDEKDGNLSLTLKGRIMIKPFISLRKIMGLPAGAG